MSFSVCLTKGYRFIWDRPDLNFVNTPLSCELNTEGPFLRFKNKSMHRYFDSKDKILLFSEANTK